MKLLNDDNAMRVEVLKYLSPGMPMENAKRIMEDSGFQCEEISTEAASMQCTAVVSINHPFCHDEVYVRLGQEAGKLTTVSVKCYGVGP
jgi:hypothetical protein